MSPSADYDDADRMGNTLETRRKMIWEREVMTVGVESFEEMSRDKSSVKRWVGKDRTRQGQCIHFNRREGRAGGYRCFSFVPIFAVK